MSEESYKVPLGVGAMDEPTAREICRLEDELTGEIILDKFAKNPQYDLDDREFDYWMRRRFG